MTIALLRDLALPHARVHRLRTALTILGVALGVAAIVALRLAYLPLDRSLETSAARLAGHAALQLTNGTVGVPEELLDEVQATPGVAAAAGSVRQFLPLGNGADRLYVLGIDLLADSKVHDYELTMADGKVADPLVFLAKADSIALDPRFMAERGLALGDGLEVQAPGGRIVLRIRAVLNAERGAGGLFDGRLAVMDVAAAQRLFGLHDRLSQVDVRLQPGASVEAVHARLVETTRGRASVESVRASIDDAERMLAVQRASATTQALGAVVVGVYIVYQALAIAVAQRRREIAILRSVGLARRQLLGLITLEATGYGLVGAVLGLPLGIGLAKLMSIPFVARIGSTPLSVPPPAVEVAAGPLLLGLVIGVVASILAGLVPAWRALAIPPLGALARTPEVGSPRYGLLAGAGLAAIALAIVLTRPDIAAALGPAGYATSSIALNVGLSLLVPFALSQLVGAAGPLVMERLGVVGLLAQRTLVGELRRFALTATVLVMCLCYVTEVGAAYASLRRSYLRWFDAVLPHADLALSAGAPPLDDGGTPLPDAVRREAAAVPGVARATGVRLAVIAYRDSAPTLMAIDLDGDPGTLGLVAGTPAKAVAAMRDQGAVVVDERFADRFGVATGDQLTLPGVVEPVVVAGVAFAQRNHRGAGTLLMDRTRYRRLWHDDAVDLVQLTLAPGADPGLVAADLRRRFGERWAVFVTALADFRAEQAAHVDRDLAGVRPLVGIAVVIALTGLVNALVAAILDRVRTIGTLRAAGASRRQVATVVLAEAAFLGLAGGVLAAIAGVVDGYYTMVLQTHALFRVTVVYHQPLLAIGLTIALAVVGAVIGALVPARRAARLRPVDALAAG